MTLTFVQDDTSPTILATLHDEGSTTPVDLSGATVKFQMRGNNDRHYRVNSACVVISALLGQVSYTWANGDLEVPGDYVVQFEITFPGGRIQTTAQPIPVTVRRQ